MDLNAYYSRIRAQKETLKGRFPEGFLSITSIANAADGGNSREGIVSEVSLDIASKSIVEGTARESTRQEIDAQRLRGESLRALNNAQAQRERNPTIILETK